MAPLRSSALLLAAFWLLQCEGSGAQLPDEKCQKNCSGAPSTGGGDSGPVTPTDRTDPTTFDDLNPTRVCTSDRFTIDPSNPRAGKPFEVSFRDEEPWEDVVLEVTCDDGEGVQLLPDETDEGSEGLVWSWFDVTACSEGAVRVALIHDRTDDDDSGTEVDSCSFDTTP